MNDSWEPTPLDPLFLDPTLRIAPPEENPLSEASGNKSGEQGEPHDVDKIIVAKFWAFDWSIDQMRSCVKERLADELKTLEELGLEYNCHPETLRRHWSMYIAWLKVFLSLLLPTSPPHFSAGRLSSFSLDSLPLKSTYSSVSKCQGKGIPPPTAKRARPKRRNKGSGTSSPLEFSNITETKTPNSEPATDGAGTKKQTKSTNKHNPETGTSIPLEFSNITGTKPPNSEPATDGAGTNKQTKSTNKHSPETGTSSPLEFSNITETKAPNSEPATDGAGTKKQTKSTNIHNPEAGTSSPLELSNATDAPVESSISGNTTGRQVTESDFVVENLSKQWGIDLPPSVANRLARARDKSFQGKDDQDEGGVGGEVSIEDEQSAELRLLEAEYKVAQAELNEARIRLRLEKARQDRKKK